MDIHVVMLCIRQIPRHQSGSLGSLYPALGFFRGSKYNLLCATIQDFLDVLQNVGLFDWQKLAK